MKVLVLDFKADISCDRSGREVKKKLLFGVIFLLFNVAKKQSFLSHLFNT